MIHKKLDAGKFELPRATSEADQHVVVPWKRRSARQRGRPNALPGCNHTTSVVWFGMPRGNPAVKLAVTVDADVHSKVLDAAEAEGKSVSAWITDAARRALLIRDGLAAVAEWEAEHGALTPAELLAARARIEPKAIRRKRSQR